jgi:hypothetical protein
MEPEIKKYRYCQHIWDEKGNIFLLIADSECVELVSKNPGKWKCRNKLLLQQMLEPLLKSKDPIIFSRYREMPIPR